MQLVIFHLFLLPIILAAYFLSPKRAIHVTGLFTLITLLLAVVKNKWVFITSAPLFYLISLFTYKFKTEEAKMKKSIKETLDRAISQNQELLHSKKEVEEKNQKIEEDIEELTGLYKVTKDLNETLDLKDTINIIINSFNSTFNYSEAKIILVDRHKVITTVIDIRPGFDKQVDTSSINPEQTPGFSQGCIERVDLEAVKNDPLVRYALTNLFPITLNNEEIKRIVTPTHLTSFSSVPLIVANELLGLVTVTNLELKSASEEDALSRLCILSAQYALEINKARLYQKLQTLAITDGLTKVYRRRHFLERYHDEILRTKKYKLNLSFLMIDIDHFKNFNEQYGHLYGDAVLGEVAKILRQGIREVDLVCRYGGEEFAIMLPETTKSQAELVAERLRQNIAANRFSAYGETTTITISIGIASLPEDAVEGQALIDKADEALFRAKREGRNRICLY